MDQTTDGISVKRYEGTGGTQVFERQRMQKIGLRVKVGTTTAIPVLGHSLGDEGVGIERIF